MLRTADVLRHGAVRTHLPLQTTSFLETYAGVWRRFGRDFEGVALRDPEHRGLR